MTKKLLILGTAILLTAFIVGFTSNPQKKTFDYLTIVQSSKVLKISSTQEAFQSINAKDLKTSDFLDFTPALLKASEYESEGWEFVETTTFPTEGWIGISIMMRKEKE